ncbi:Formate dehydrogenase chain D [Clostridiaceae bacterium JG1575]|nr:Formate dehydrogenase chain D [Clostridiaceae bacterium JG1575]
MSKTGDAILLIGGESRRMGFDKSTLTLDGRSLLHLQIQRLSAVFERILLVGHDPLPPKGLSAYKKVHYVADQWPGRGPLVGLHAGLLAAQSEYVFFLACDMPNWDEDLLIRLKMQVDHLTQEDGLVLKTAVPEALQPFFAFYARSLLPLVQESLTRGEGSLTRLIQRAGFLQLSYARGELFANLNTPKDLAQHPKHLPEGLAPVMITRFEGSGFQSLTDEVMQEEPIAIFLEQTPWTTLWATPTDLGDLVLGHLFTQGVLQPGDPLPQLLLQEEPKEGPRAWRVRVHCPTMDWTLRRDQPLDEARALRPRRPLRLGLEEIFQAVQAFEHRSELFVRSGAAHSCALLAYGELLLVREDIGRHNALDKLIGAALRQRLDLSQCAILLSGRMALEMTQKVARTEVPCLLSRSAPSRSSIELARRVDLTLAGFIRGRRLNCYHLNPAHVWVLPTD